MQNSIVFLFLMTGMIMGSEKGFFYREFWGKNNPAVSNVTGRLRVNDARVSLDKRWGVRPEGSANGLMLIPVRMPLFDASSAELYLELWGGHPGTENKRVTVNGRTTHTIPADGAAGHHCAYTYPVIPLKTGDLVKGSNAFQFACDRGSTFWGHYIVDNACVRLVLKDTAAVLRRSGYAGFSARVQLAGGKRTVSDETALALDFPAAFADSITAVDYLARYTGFDDRGSMTDTGWHGFTFKRKWRNHPGSTDTAPFTVTWNTAAVPDQKSPMALRAVVHLKGGLKYRTPVLDGLAFGKKREKTVMYQADSLISHFWSRAGKEKRVTITIPAGAIKAMTSARLLVKTWDGGAGTVKHPFTVNGHPYTVISGKSIHDVVHTDTEVSPEHLRVGKNVIRVLSDTEHHGIEVLYPGPVIIVRQR